MRGLPERGGERPSAWRWGVLAGAGILLGLTLGGVVWYGLTQRHAAGLEALAAPSALSRRALAEPPEADPAEAIQALRGFLAAYPRHRAAPQAWYALGNLLYQTGAYDEALEAFGQAARRGEGVLVGLSRLGLGYTWEAKGDWARALEAYQDGAKGARPGELLAGEFLLGSARSQEQLERPAEAAATYRQFLQDFPQSVRADDVRARRARLESRPLEQ